MAKILLKLWSYEWCVWKKKFNLLLHVHVISQKLYILKWWLKLFYVLWFRWDRNMKQD